MIADSRLAQLTRRREPALGLVPDLGGTKPLVEAVVAALCGRGARVETGVFGAKMQVESVNDGPFTVLVEV